MSEPSVDELLLRKDAESLCGHVHLSPEQQVELDDLKVSLYPGKYLRSHPEINSIIEYITTKVIEASPTDVDGYIADTLSTSQLQENVEQYVLEAKEAQIFRKRVLAYAERQSRFLSLRSIASRRLYATEAASTGSGKLVLNLVCPHQSLIVKKEVERVDIPATSGDMGILANHVPTIQQLKPGVVEINADGKSTKYFVSGGFAVVSPDNTLNINVLEAVTSEQVDKNLIKSSLSDAMSRADKGTDEEKALANAEIEVYQALEKAF